jgi:hypothetical protein
MAQAEFIFNVQILAGYVSVGTARIMITDKAFYFALRG